MGETKIIPEHFCGVWSATPTPFTKNMTIDKVAVQRMVEHHLRVGVKGLLLCGSCGEGPWMSDEQRRILIRTAAEYSKGRLLLAAQVTDNSAIRIVENMKMAREEDADFAVIAPPHFLMNATPENITKLYVEAIHKSPLPVGIYDLGSRVSVLVPNECLKKILNEKKVILVKDSSADPKRMKIALAARKKRKRLYLLNGDEFNCVKYLEAGYDGLLLGGGIFNGYLAGMIMEAVKADDIRRARCLQKRMNRLMWDVYGGKDVSCWLTGLKELLVQMHIFRTNKSFLNYPLTASCRKAIKTALKREADILLP